MVDDVANADMSDGAPRAGDGAPLHEVLHEAVKHLERAVELRPEDPVINDHLGDAYWRTGRQLEARFQWRHALALGAEPPADETIKQKLRNGLPPVNAGTPGTQRGPVRR